MPVITRDELIAIATAVVAGMLVARHLTYRVTPSGAWVVPGVGTFPRPWRITARDLDRVVEVADYEYEEPDNCSSLLLADGHTLHLTPSSFEEDED